MNRTTVMTTVTLASCLCTAAELRLMYVCTSGHQGLDPVKGLAIAVGMESISEDEDLCEYELR